MKSVSCGGFCSRSQANIAKSLTYGLSWSVRIWAGIQPLHTASDTCIAVCIYAQYRMAVVGALLQTWSSYSQGVAQLWQWPSGVVAPFRGSDMNL